jgi:hypothetical protein
MRTRTRTKKRRWTPLLCTAMRRASFTSQVGRIGKGERRKVK